ncbi:MAG: hypothetical protein NHB32_25315 [Fischerella sp. CENA71]|nr:hypothetical protein [Fischerella sp. CENA71]
MQHKRQGAGSRVQGAGRRIRHGNSEFSSKGEELPPAPRSLPPASFGEVVPLFEAIRTTPVLDKLTLELQRTPRRAARSATLSVRVACLWLQPPASPVS